MVSCCLMHSIYTYLHFSATFVFHFKQLVAAKNPHHTRSNWAIDTILSISLLQAFFRYFTNIHDFNKKKVYTIKNSVCGFMLPDAFHIHISSFFSNFCFYFKQLVEVKNPHHIRSNWAIDTILLIPLLQTFFCHFTNIHDFNKKYDLLAGTAQQRPSISNVRV